MPVITTTQGRSFAIATSQSILDAALQEGVQLAYSCRTGRCSTCKCKVIRGSSTALHPELGLSHQELDKGWILTCVRTAETDLEIEADSLDGLELATPKTTPCRIQSLDRVAPDVLKVCLRLPPNNPLSFRPGQYVDVIGPGGVRRSYSLANAEQDDKMLELHIRAVEGGIMSNYWFEQAKVNDLLRLHGPLGTFFLRDIDQLDLVFLATGTGIAPVKAMLEGLEQTAPDQRPRSVTVYWGGRTPEDLYWDLAHASFPHRFVPVLSRADEHWTGMRGHVQQALIAERFDPARSVVYACGSDAMIHSARDVLLQSGLPENRFFSDAFVCSATI